MTRPFLLTRCVLIGDGRGETRCVDCGHRLFDVEAGGCPKRRRGEAMIVGSALAIVVALAVGAVWGAIEIVRVLGHGF